MYPYRYYRYINLPKLPENILQKVNWNFNEYEKKTTEQSDNIYTWSDSFNDEVNQWCQNNICSDMYWGFQIIRGDLSPHKDNGTLTKFVYLLDNGGPDVITEWFNEDKTTVVDSVILETHRWHILKVDSFHGVRGVLPSKTRFSITGVIF
jgi:hypothetical protein